ncbi:hypothetical protein Tco_0980472 [Tanacetum coccineum]
MSSIRFTVKNGKTQLYLEFKTFCQSTRLDYNNGSNAIMPQTEAVKAELLKLGLHNDRNEIETPNVLVNKTPLLKTCHPDKGTCTSQLLPEGTPTNPKDSGRNIQLTDMGLPSTMVTDLSGADTKISDFNALMEDSKDDLRDLSDEEIFEAGYEMEIDLPYATKEHSQPPLFTDKVTPYDEHHSPSHPESQPEKHKKSPEPYDSESSSALPYFKDYDNYMPTTERVLAKNIKGFSEHIEGLNKIITNLKSVQDAVKEDPALNVKVLEATEAYVKNPSNLIKLNTDMKEIIEAIQNTFNAQNDHLATWAESSKSMAWNVGPRLTRIETTHATIQYDLALLKTNTADIKAYGH